MASVWLESDLDAMLRLAELREAVAGRADSSLHAQITALEDRLGLTPKARRQLQWEVSQDAARATSEQPAQVRKLRAV